jgi:hypothetical protein
MGSDGQFFHGIKNRIKNTTGRPKKNRELAYELLKVGKSTRYICRTIGCKPRTLIRIKKEYEKIGYEVKDPDLEKIERENLDFDNECKEAIGISFYSWLSSRTIPKHVKCYFNFNKRVWEKIWDKPNIFLVKNRANPLADQLALKFIEVFGEDKKRIRRRKKHIRFLFRFLGREDICNRHLSMSRARDPNEVREIPEMTFTDFPLKLEQATNNFVSRITDKFGEKEGKEAELVIKLKMVTQMRTGSEDEQRELWGIKVGSNGSTYVIM